MVFSQTGTAFAAQNAEVADTAVEASAEEEPEAEAAVVEEPEKPEEAKEPEVAPAEVAPAEGTSAEGTENEAPSAYERQDEVTTEEEPEEAEAAGTMEGSEASSTEEATVEEPGEGSTEEVPAETDETVEEPEEEVAGKEAKKEDEHWSIELDPEDAPDGNDYWSVFTDATLEIGYRNLIVPEGAEYEMAWYVGTGGWDDAGRRFDGYNLAQNDSWHLNGDKIMLDGNPLWHKGIRRIEVRVAVVSEGEEYGSAQMGFDVEESFMEQHWNFGTRTLLPGWDQWIDRRQGGYVQNKQHPWGDGVEFTVTNVHVQDVQGQDVVSIEEASEDGWKLRAKNGGESRVMVQYTDEEGREGTEAFTLYVAEDVYEVDVWTQSGSDRVLPGGVVDIRAQARHEYFDPGTQEYTSSSEEELAGVTYSWRLDYYDDYVEEQLRDYITLTQDANDPRHVTVSFANVPDSWENDAEINVIVTIEENGITAENNYWLHMRHQYLELWPTGIDGNIELGDEVTITPELREYPADNEDGYSVLPADQVKFEVETYDDRAYSVDDSVPGVFVIRRLREYSSSFRIRAYVKNEEGNYNEVDDREYWFNHRDYNIWFEQHDLDLYNDNPDAPALELRTDHLGDNWQGRLDLKILVGHWNRDHWEGMLEESDFTITPAGETVKVALSAAYLQSLDDYEDIRVAAEIYPKNVEQTDDNRISETDAWFHIRQAKEEYDREWDRTMLPGWDGRVDGSYRVHIENSEYPDGHDEDYDVTNVEVISDDPAPGEKGDVVVEFRHEQNDDDHWWYYRVGHRGEATLRVTYEDIHGQTQSYEFKLHVGDDVYNVWIESEGNKGNALPGEEIRLFARGNHEYRDENGDQHGDDEGLGYVWDFEYGNEYADLEVSADPSVAVLRFKDLPDGWDEINENVRVCVRVLDEEGHETEGYDSREFWVRTDYTEVWPLEIDKGLDVGASIENIPFEVRRYTFGDDDYEVIDDLYDVTYEWHFDQNALSITEMRDGNPVEIGDGDTSGSPVTITRKGNWHTDFNVCAKWHENGEYRDTWGNYYFDDKNYDFWYEIDGNDTIYSDDFREFGFNLDNLEGVDFELVPEVGVGRWNEESGFEHPITQDQGWWYDADKHTITFSGEMLYDQGIDRLETRISLRIGGVEVADEWRGFDVREAWFDFHGEFDDAVLFVDDEWYVSKNGNVYLETSWLPDGAEGSYTITSIQFDMPEDEFDTRDAVDVTEEENGWLFKAVRGGEANVHVNLRVQGDSDGTYVTYEKEKNFRIIVGGRRINMGLETETGSDRLQPGGSIRVFPQIYAEEYDWNTGDRYGIDTSDYQVRYEVRCNRIDQRIIDEQFDGDFDRATERGEFWDYAEDPESRSIILFTEENADNMELEIEAYLIDPDSGEECARADRRVFVNSLIYAVELFEEGGAEPYTWDKELPPGAEVTLVPRLMKKEGDGAFEPVEDTDVTYRMGWYSGDENDQERDPAHIIVSDGGRELRPNDEISGPVAIKRNVDWSFNFNVEAEWEDEDGWMQNLSKTLICDDVYYSDGFNFNNDRGDDHYTWYYTDEAIDVVPDRARLDALEARGYPVETTVEAGYLEYGEIRPITGYDISRVFDPQTGLHASGDELLDLYEALRFQANEDGDTWGRITLRLHAELNGVVLTDYMLRITITKPYLEITGLRTDMGVGQTQTFEGGNAELYLEDSVHDTGDYYEGGSYFDIDITNIALKNAGDGEFLEITQNGADWSLKALKKTENRVPVIFTFTGGPEGYDTFEAHIAIADGVFDLELRNSKGERVENLDVLLGGTEKLVPYVTYTEFGENGPTVIELPELATEGIPYCYGTDERYNENVIAMSGELDITGLRRGNTDLEIVVTIYDGRDPEMDVYELWSHVNVNVYVSMAVLDLPENATVYAVPGLTYTADEIGQKVGGTLTVYSMKQPDGAEYPITDYRLEEVIGGDGKLTLTDGDERAYMTLNVASDAPLTESTLILGARESFGNRASAGLKVKVQDATIASNWAGNKATIAKTKHKDVKITFSDGDEIASIATSNKDIVTAKKQGALAAGDAGKLVQNIRVTAGTKAGTGKITVKLRSGKSIVLTVTVPKVNCTGITAKSSYTVTTLSTIDMGVKLNPVYSDNTITYKSANTKIATVTSKGVVKGIKVGKTTITITTSNKKTKKVTINVKQGTTGLTTAKTAYTVVVGKTVSIGAKKKPTNSADPIKYTSANKAIATVSSTGAIKGVKAGKTTITVKSGTKTKKVTVTVKPKTTGITTLKTAYTVKVKKTVSLGAKTVPATSGEPLTYTSSNAKIATVSKAGVVTGVKKGKVTITIKSGAVTKKVTVTVN